MFERSLEEASVQFRKIEFSSAVSQKRCLKKGYGVAICPQIAIEEELEAGEVMALDTENIVVDTPVLMIWHIDKWCSPLLKKFMDLTKEVVS